MENASQALIIAGAILLAILIIAIGMFIFNSASKRIREGANEIDKQTIQAQNTIYQNYMDKVIKGSDVRTFLEKINTSVANAEAKKAVSLDIKLGDPAPNLNQGGAAVPAMTDDSKEAFTAYSEGLIKLRRAVKSNENYKLEEDEKLRTKEGLIKGVILKAVEEK